MSGSPNSPGPGYNAPPYTPPGSPVFAQTQQQLGQLAQTIQSINQSLNAILAQLRTGVSLIAQVPTFAFANLPAAATNPALVVFSSNVRKPGEGPGLGSGMTIFSDGVAWYTTAGTLATV